MSRRTLLVRRFNALQGTVSRLDTSGALFACISLAISLSWLFALIPLTIAVGFNKAWSTLCYYWLERPALPDFLTPKSSVLLGHYFGDFTQVLLMSRQTSPYAAVGGNLPSQYPPLAHALLLPFGFLPLRMSVTLYTTLCISFVGWTVSQIQKGANKILIISGVLLSTASISAIDRGNLVLLSFGLVLLVVDRVDSPGWRNPTLLAIAISIKPYLLLMIPALMPQTGKKRFLTSTLAVTGLLNTACFLLFEGGIRTNGPVFMRMLVRATAETSSRFGHTAVSLLPHQIGTCFLLVGFAITALILLFKNSAPLSVKALFACAAIVTFMPYVPTYQLIFLFVPALLMMRDTNLENSLRTVVLVIGGLLLVPKQFPITERLGVAPLVDQLLSFALWSLGACALHRLKSEPLNS